MLFLRSVSRTSAIGTMQTMQDEQAVSYMLGTSPSDIFVKTIICTELVNG
jgi:hypothetical protein